MMRRSRASLRAALGGVGAVVVGQVMPVSYAAPVPGPVSGLRWTGTIIRRQVEQHSNGDGDTDNDVDPRGPGKIAPQVWIPAVVVVVVLLIAFVLVWTRTNVFSRLRNALCGSRMRIRTRIQSAATTREVTASQLAGTGAGTGTGTTGATGGGRTLRLGRMRRTRRTPSQISVTSLPVYMKEPGDQELVIFRGPDDMQDASHAIAEAREAEDEDDDSVQQSIVMRESAAIYDPAPIPASSQNPSLANQTEASAVNLNDNDTANADSSTAELIARDHGSVIENVVTRDSNYSAGRDSTASSAGSARPLSLAPSEAPPDYVTEDGHASVQVFVPPGLSGTLDPLPRALASSSDSPTTPPAPPTSSTTAAAATSPSTSESTQPNRRSVFRGFHLFNLGSSSSSDANANANANTAPPPPPIPPTSSREVPNSNSNNTNSTNASVSASASGSTPTSPPPPSRARHVRHRSSQSGLGSGSGSTFSLPFRPLSRQRSSTTLHSSPSRPNLTSPSALSINSLQISSPLAHTLTRTDIRYPRSGPTPEQVRLLSSMESLGRFGVPYGRDAVEYARNSRLELQLDPPPAFEDPVEEGEPSATSGGDEEAGHEEAPRHSGARDSEDHLAADDEHQSSSSPVPDVERSRTRSTDRSRERRQGSTGTIADPTIPPRLLVPLFM